MKIFYSEDELDAFLQRTKKTIDMAYLDTKTRYGQEQANRAMYDYFYNCDSNGFAKDENKIKMQEFTYHSNEFYQVLLDFALSKTMLDIENNDCCLFSLDDVQAYVNADDATLDYDEKRIIEIVAVGTAWSTFWIINLISCNPRIKDILVRAFISNRYVNGRKQELNATPKSKSISLSNGGKMLLSKPKLNRDIDTMNDDDDYGIGYFDPQALVIVNAQLPSDFSK